MKFFRFTILLALIIFVGGLFYWALFTPKEEISERIYKTLKEQEKHADLFFKKVSFEEVSAGVKYWQLAAETAMVNKSTGISTLQNAEGTFFKNGRAVLKFRSPAAMWDMKQKEIYLDKPLGYDIALERKIVSLLKSFKQEPFSIFNFPKIYQKEPGYWFQAKNLSWKLADQKILCTGGILLNKGEVAGYAEKLEGDVALERVSLEGQPRLLINLGKDAPVTIEAEVFEVLNPKDTFLAHGKTRISYQDIHASGDSARYLISAQEVVLEGNAQAEQGENKLSGDKVLVSLKDQKISLLGKGKVVVK